jgi:hypothetical protein
MPSLTPSVQPSKITSTKPTLMPSLEFANAELYTQWHTIFEAILLNFIYVKLDAPSHLQSHLPKLHPC